MSQVKLSLDAVSSDTAGEVLALNSPSADFSMQISFSGTITISGFVVYLEASLDGVSFFHAGSISGQTSGVGVVLNTSDALALFIRANAVGLSGGGTVTAYIAVAAK
jgi:hypothetical protein